MIAAAEVWAAAAAGSPGVVVLRGEAGIGKSRLAEEVLSRAAADGALVLTGSCAPLVGQAVPFAPLREALAPLLRDGAPGLPPEAGDRLRLLLRGNAPEGARAPGTSPAPQQGQLLDAVRSTLQAVAAAQPLLLLVEDLHWADRSTVVLLSFLERALRHADGSRLVLVVTSRPEVADDAATFIAETARGARNRVLDLPALSGEDVRAMLHLLAVEEEAAEPTDSRVQQVAERSDGNPFLVEELARAGAEHVPLATRDLLGVRLQGLGPTALEVLRTAAVLGRPHVAHEILAGACPLSPEHLLDALRDCVGRDLLIPAGDGYVFRHSLFQELVLSKALEGERRVLHGRVADVLAGLPAHERRPAGEVAHHYLRSGNRGAALTWILRAARAAERARGLAEAAQAYDEAVALWPLVPDAALVAGQDLGSLLTRCGDSLLAAGRASEAGRRYVEAITEEAREGKESSSLHVKRARCLFDVGDRVAALAETTVAVRLAEDPRVASGSPDVADALGAHASAQVWTGHADRGLPLAERAVAVATATGSPWITGLALGRQALCLDYLGVQDEASQLYQEALDLIGHEPERAHQRGITASNLVECLRQSGRLSEALAVASREVAAGLSSGSVQGIGVLDMLNCAAHCYFVRGQWDRAEQMSRQALQQASLEQEPWAADVQIALHVGRGEADAADAILGRTFHSRIGLGADFARKALGHASDIAILRGDLATGYSFVLQGLDVVAGTHEEKRSGRLLLTGLRIAADRAERARAGRDARAAEAAVRDGEQLLSRSTELPAAPPTCTTPPPGVVTTKALRAQWVAEFSRLRGRSDRALWSSAADAWEQLSRPHPAAQCRLRAAEAIAEGRGARADLTRHLLAAHRIAGDLRARPLQQQVLALAARTRVDLEHDEHRSRPGAAPGGRRPFGLTAREVDVLVLLAEGLTNAQIAGRLFISPNTAGIHVSRILAKLGVNSRVRAAGIAHDLELGSPASG